jgi:hypothetical protein
MELYEIIASLIVALAWPAVILILVFGVRRSIDRAHKQHLYDRGPEQYRMHARSNGLTGYET